MEKSKFIETGTWWTGPVILEAGVIDRTAAEVFTTGQCHALALALHEHTGWPLRGLYRRPIKDVNEDTPAHTVVESPKGLVDIKGLGVLQRHKEWSNILSVSKKDVLNFEHRDYAAPNMEAAQAFVDAVLKLYSTQKGEKYRAEKQTSSE